nr:uncharacterized protein CI109_004678 [Kwoniella shandongensis]KAA5526902.1 hypothetical protein CI109_004678 [Kwoniella shandongensis]
MSRSPTPPPSQIQKGRPASSSNCIALPSTSPRNHSFIQGPSDRLDRSSPGPSTLKTSPTTVETIVHVHTTSILLESDNDGTRVSSDVPPLPERGVDKSTGLKRTLHVSLEEQEEGGTTSPSKRRSPSVDIPGFKFIRERTKKEMHEMAHNRDIERLLNENKRLTVETDTFRRSLSAAKEEFEESRQRLNEEKSDLETKLSEKKDQLQGLFDTMDMNKKQLEQMHLSLSEGVERENRMKAEIERMLAQRKSAMGTLKELAEVKKQKQECEDALRSVRREMEEEILGKDKAQKKVEELKGEVYMLKTAKAELVNKVEDMENAKATATEEWNTLKDEIDREKTELEANILAWEKERKNLEDRAIKAENDCNDLRQAKASLQVELDTAKVTVKHTNKRAALVDTLEGRVRDLEMEKENRMKEYNFLSDQLATTVASLVHAKEEKNKSDKRATQLESELGTTKKGLADEKAARTTEVQKHQATHREAKQKIAQWQEKVNHLKTKLELVTTSGDTSNNSAELYEEMRKRNEEVERLESQIKKLLEANVEFAQEEAARERILADAEAKVDEVKAENERLVAAHQEEMEDLKRRIHQDAQLLIGSDFSIERAVSTSSQSSSSASSASSASSEQHSGEPESIIVSKADYDAMERDITKKNRKIDSLQRDLIRIRTERDSRAPSVSSIESEVQPRTPSDQPLPTFRGPSLLHRGDSASNSAKQYHGRRDSEARQRTVIDALRALRRLGE